MPPNFLPFLYQTRTIQRISPVSFVLGFNRWAHYEPRQSRRQPKPDNSIPFERDGDHANESDEFFEQESTITPSEAQIFKGIFDEIAQGRMPAPKKRRPFDEMLQSSPSATGTSDMARSIVEQARVTDFREKILRRYPQSLRNAAQVALGLFELDAEQQGVQTSKNVLELDQASERLFAERLRYDRARNEEKSRVDKLMDDCDTDTALWKVLEAEVFSLPQRLGILETKPPVAAQQNTKKTKKKSTPKTKSEKTEVADRRIMDVHGPLYSHYLNRGLALLDTAFSQSSPYVFKVLPRIKELGLPSYVLGVSTAFYARLARIYWERHGDATSTLDMLQEMTETGLYPNREVEALLKSLRIQLHGCTWGAQGPFVMAMMEAPPYDAALVQRLEEMDEFVRQSVLEQAKERRA